MLASLWECKENVHPRPVAETAFFSEVVTYESSCIYDFPEDKLGLVMKNIHFKSHSSHVEKYRRLLLLCPLQIVCMTAYLLWTWS